MQLRLFLLSTTISFAFLVPWPAQAMDCPCTWENVLCQTDAVAEVEVFLATKTTKDRMEVRRVIWNGTKHAIRPRPGRSQTAGR